jgi:nucleotide-binding universal stress UspA family protein
MKLLIAYDGSDCAEAALRDLKRAGLPPVAEAIVLSVADTWQPPDNHQPETPLPAWLAEAIQQERVETEQAVKQMHAHAAYAAAYVQGKFPQWHVQAEAVADSPAWAIIKRADEWQPDLIVMGSHGRTALGRFFMGSVSQTVLTMATCTVRVVRGDASSHTSEKEPIRLIVGMDGSTHALATLNVIKARVWPAGTQARIVVALDAFMSTIVGSGHKRVMPWVKADEGAKMWMQHMARVTAQELRAVGLDAEALVKAGDPKHVLVHEAEQWNADCIFVGARGLNAIERFVLGSVSTAVAARAHCAVEVVHVHT